MTPLHERIVALVKRSGVDGISGDDLFAIVYDGQLQRYQGGHAGHNETRSRKTLKANVWLINQQLNGCRIVASRCHGGRYWWQNLVPQTQESNHVRLFSEASG